MPRRPATGELIGQVADATAADADQALAKMERQVSDATVKGASVLAGGSRLTDGELAKGRFFAPTAARPASSSM